MSVFGWDKNKKCNPKYGIGIYHRNKQNGLWAIPNR